VTSYGNCTGAANTTKFPEPVTVWGWIKNWILLSLLYFLLLLLRDIATIKD